MRTPRIAAGILIAFLFGLFLPPALGAAAAFQSETKTAESPGLKVTATFPVTGNAAVDALTRGHIDQMIADLRQLYEDQGDSNATNVEITYETFRLNEDVASFLYTEDAYTQGAAYPILFFATDSFNLETGKRILLTDVINGDPVTVLAPLVKEQLRERLGQEVYDQLDLDDLNEALSDASAYDAFALSPDGLILQLQEGLIGPHALGAPRLTIGYDEIAVYPWVLER